MAATVSPPADITPPPLPDRIRMVREAIEEAETWYAGGLTPEPWDPWAA